MKHLEVTQICATLTTQVLWAMNMCIKFNVFVWQKVSKLSCHGFFVAKKHVEINMEKYRTIGKG